MRMIERSFSAIMKLSILLSCFGGSLFAGTYYVTPIGFFRTALDEDYGGHGI